MSGILWLALLATLVQQIFVTLGKAIVPVIGPAMTQALGVKPELIGLYVAVAGVASTLGAASSGRWIHRIGAMRTSQASLLLVAAGLGLTAPGWIPLFALGACLLGLGTVMATPASSEILARFATPAQAPMIFSLKQTGVPAGTMLAGLIGPICVSLADWRAALLVVAGGTLAITLMLQPLTRHLEPSGATGKSTRQSGMLATMRATFRDPAMRSLALSQGAYVGVQNTFGTFFVTFVVVKLHWDLITAGQVFAAAQVVAVFSRVGWGGVANRVGGLYLLGVLGIIMAAVVGLLGLVTPAWPFPAVVAVALALASSAVSWQGVGMSEIAARSPPGMVGAMTGGVIAFGSATAILYPVAMTAILAATDSYALCFWLSAVPPVLAAAPLLRSRKPAAAPSPSHR